MTAEAEVSRRDEWHSNAPSPLAPIWPASMFGLEGIAVERAKTNSRRNRRFAGISSRGQFQSENRKQTGSFVISIHAGMSNIEQPKNRCNLSV